MATNLVARLALALSGSFDNPLDVGGASYPLNFGQNLNFTNGSGANQASSVFTDTRTLAASATENLDLSGSLQDAYNNIIAFTKIKALLIVADPANVNNVVVGGAASNAFASIFGATTHTTIVKPGGFVCWGAPDAAGYAVTDATADLLKIANSAGGSSVNYTIIIIGA